METRESFGLARYKTARSLQSEMRRYWIDGVVTGSRDESRLGKLADLLRNLNWLSNTSIL